MVIDVTPKYLRIRLKRPTLFRKFRTHDIGRKGHSLRIAGLNRTTGKWETQSWLINKQDIKNKDITTQNLLFKVADELSYPQVKQLSAKIDKIMG